MNMQLGADTPWGIFAGLHLGFRVWGLRDLRVSEFRGLGSRLPRGLGFRGIGFRGLGV